MTEFTQGVGGAESSRIPTESELLPFSNDGSEHLDEEWSLIAHIECRQIMERSNAIRSGLVASAREQGLNFTQTGAAADPDGDGEMNLWRAPLTLPNGEVAMLESFSKPAGDGHGEMPLVGVDRVTIKHAGNVVENLMYGLGGEGNRFSNSSTLLAKTGGLGELDNWSLMRTVGDAVVGLEMSIEAGLRPKQIGVHCHDNQNHLYVSYSPEANREDEIALAVVTARSTDEEAKIVNYGLQERRMPKYGVRKFLQAMGFQDYWPEDTKRLKQSPRVLGDLFDAMCSSLPKLNSGTQ